MLDRMGYVNILYDILRVNSLFFHTQVLTDVCWGIFRVWLLGFLWTAVLCLILCLVSSMTVFAASGSMAE
ncbi:MAG: hypothetical protein HFI93_03875 [Lachnospiraceae bacterium]|nr:hypothetical protein [Lachnospiraceae bacterium]